MAQNTEPQPPRPPTGNFRGEFVRSLIFLGVVVGALLGLLQIPPY